ncbi:N-6 DNA methylase [Fructobacillus americanaquae]|uniref:site-specific DNA-methyltransferase (adenine-specific) n=1 Tax=Fructobacillus americanaquae TaxID=2940302 RepID=A0ABY5C3W6_9LACO|nr:N-6 DNA methylase [Fructobacillus americanaquae]USS92020.1 SAM-dependent methyltransferase [Fructobacillus americanaquae]
MDFNKLLGVKESYQASYELEKIIFDQQKREEMFHRFLAERPDLSYDWFTEYFQAEQAERKEKKQDFTPDSVVQIASRLIGTTDSNADICAGTGGLTIKRWNENKNARFYCEEFSDRAIPFLLFNLSIRNMNATVWHGDSLSRECFGIYELTEGDKFSSIQKVEEGQFTKAQTVIMNPPYSLRWNPDPSYIEQDRFKDFGVLAPKSKADFAFLLDGYSKLEDGGTMAVILPHGVLFRSSAEGKIRQKILENNMLDAMIGLPGKIFIATDIPTVILVLKKNRQRKDLLVIDASKEFEKGKNKNILRPEDIDKIVHTYEKRQSVDKYAQVVEFDEIAENDFNLNIPRYVDTFEEDEPIDILANLQDLRKVDQMIKKTENEIAILLDQLVATNSMETAKELDEIKKYYDEKLGRQKKKREQL